MLHPSASKLGGNSWPKLIEQIFQSMYWHAQQHTLQFGDGGWISKVAAAQRLTRHRSAGGSWWVRDCASLGIVFSPPLLIALFLSWPMSFFLLLLFQFSSPSHWQGWSEWGAGECSIAGHSSESEILFMGLGSEFLHNYLRSGMPYVQRPICEMHTHFRIPPRCTLIHFYFTMPSRCNISST